MNLRNVKVGKLSYYVAMATVLVLGGYMTASLFNIVQLSYSWYLGVISASWGGLLVMEALFESNKRKNWVGWLTAAIGVLLIGDGVTLLWNNPSLVLFYAKSLAGFTVKQIVYVVAVVLTAYEVFVDMR